MPNYDPRRSRPTPKVAPDEESAPIDVLLGPDREGADDAATAAAEGSDDAADGAARREAEPLPAPVRRAEPRPSQLVQLAPLLGAVLLVVVLWLLRRRRRS